MNKEVKINYRNNVRDKYLLPKLFKLGYSRNDIEFNEKQLVCKGRRKIFIIADVIIRINNQPKIIITVRHGGEELTEYIKEKTLAYARLLPSPAPIIVLTNGLKTEVYNNINTNIISKIPTKKELIKSNNKNNIAITEKLQEKSLNNIFKPISLWDKIIKKSPYHEENMKAFSSPEEDITIFNKKIVHHTNYKPLIPTGNDTVSIRVSSPKDLIDKIFLYYTIDESKPIGHQGKVENGSKIELKTKYIETNSKEETIQWWEGRIPAYNNNTMVKYIIEGYNTKNNRSYFADNKEDLNDATIFSYQIQEYKTPTWAKKAIIYQILIDRFCDGNPSNNYDLNFNKTGYQGGDLQGIINKLDYINSLGVTAIWLSPFYQGTAYHGYHITDFFKVDKHFGNNKLLKKLIDKAHQLGLKVILDFVPNHCSKDHPFFLEAQKDKNSPYYNWFNFYNWPDEYEMFCGVPELPIINNDNPEVRKYTIKQALHWLIDYNVDGLRLDHAYGPSHAFWVEFRKEIKANKPEAYIFGEVWEGPGITQKYAGELDGCFDFSLVWSFKELFIHNSKTVSEFKADLDYLNKTYPNEFIMGKFLDNHDMTRFLWEANNDKRRLKLAAICQFSLKGTQFIYYGTEVGVSQTKDCRDDNTASIIFDNTRNFMLWDEKQDTDLYHFYQNLCQIRKKHDILSLEDRIDLLIDDNNGIWVYAKKNHKEELIIILNTKDKNNLLEVDLSKLNLANKDQLTNLINHKNYQIIDKKLRLNLAPLEGLLLK